MSLQFRPFLETPAAVKHVHHMIIRQCIAPDGSTDEEYFERFVDRIGDDCRENTRMPFLECRAYLFAWSAGGKV